MKATFLTSDSEEALKRKFVRSTLKRWKGKINNVRKMKQKKRGRKKTQLLCNKDLIKSETKGNRFGKILKPKKN